MTTFGIAIPTYNKHVKYLIELLDSIKESTILPDSVSISCSSMTENIDLPEYPFEIILTVTDQYMNPAQNRNIAASKLTTELISFVDGDDLVLPNRTEFLIKAMKNSDIAVHNYIFIGNENVDSGILISHNNYINAIYDSPMFPKNSVEHKTYHCAHVTMRKYLFDMFKFNENESFKYTEDSELLRRIVESGHYIDYIENTLSVYRK